MERVLGQAPEGTPLPLIVVVHGLGDTPEHFLDLFSSMNLRARIVAPRGLDSWGDGYSWFPLRDAPDFATRVEAAARHVERLTADVAQAHPVCGPPIVTGFSQGGMLSFALAATAQSAFTEALPIAGFLPDGIAIARRATPLPVFALHGDGDQRVSVFLARASIARLSESGAVATLREYRGAGHTISPDMHEDLEAELRAAAARACP